MSLIDLTVMFLLVLGGVVGGALAAYFGLSFGPALLLGLCVQFPLFGAAFVVLSALDCVYSWRNGRPHWPACARCSNTEYSLEWIHGSLVTACPCGAQYVRHGLEFREVLPGGVSRPYLRWVPFRRWVDARTPDTTPVPEPYRGSEPPR